MCDKLPLDIYMSMLLYFKKRIEDEGYFFSVSLFIPWSASTLLSHIKSSRKSGETLRGCIGSDFFVVFEDLRSGNRDIYGTPVLINGRVLNPEGIPIITESSEQSYPFIEGGDSYFLLIFSDDRDAQGWSSLYYTKVSPMGQVIDSTGILLFMGSEPWPSGNYGFAFLNPAASYWNNNIFLCSYTKIYTWWMEENACAARFFLDPVSDFRWESHFYQTSWGGNSDVSYGTDKFFLLCDVWYNLPIIHFIYDTATASDTFLYLSEQFYSAGGTIWGEGY
jgi:hypothetical protein